MPTYIITGVNRGLGLEFVRQLSLSGSNTILGTVRPGATLTDLNDATSSHANVHVLECDTASLDSISKLAQSVPKIVEKKGDGKINFILNNAGINATSSDTSLTIDPASMHNHIAINVLGPAKVIEMLAPHLAQGAVVMNMTSGLGSVGKSVSNTKCCTYSISKAALNMLTVHQAKDLKGKAVVICMDPGWVKTRMGGEGAMMEAEDSIKGMLSVVHGAKEGDTAKFYKYDGSLEEW